MPPTTTEEPGCCYGNPDAAYSKKWMESCTAFYTQRDCMLLTNDDGDARCHWEAKDEEYDCSQLWPTTTSSAPEEGCCAGDSAKNNEMCADKVGREQCERSGKCAFREGLDADCELPTTPEEPWMGAKAEQKLARSVGVGETLQSTTISLSSLLLIVAAAFVVHQVYRFWVARQAHAGYAKLAEAAPSSAAGNYQAV